MSWGRSRSSQPGSVEKIGGDILDAAAPTVGADAAALLLYDREHRMLRAKAASGSGGALGGRSTSRSATTSTSGC